MSARCLRRERWPRRRLTVPGAVGLGAQHGYAYLALLIGIAIIGVAAAASIQLGGLYQRRMAEKELLYVGGQFQRALLSYSDSTPVGQATQPRTLEELVRDPRYPNPLRHLRRVYVDPMTGKADWVLVRSPNGQTIIGIHSASRERPIQLRQFAEEFRGFEDRRSYAQWVFVARPPRLAQGQRPPSATGAVVLPSAVFPAGPVPVAGDGSGLQEGGVDAAGGGASAISGSAADEGFGTGGGFSNDGGFGTNGGFSNGGAFGSGSSGFSNGGGFSSNGGFSNGDGFSANGRFSNGGGFSSGSGMSH